MSCNRMQIANSIADSIPKWRIHRGGNASRPLTLVSARKAVCGDTCRLLQSVMPLAEASDAISIGLALEFDSHFLGQHAKSIRDRASAKAARYDQVVPVLNNVAICKAIAELRRYHANQPATRICPPCVSQKCERNST